MPDRLTPFGKYFLLERINVGGMAEVYKAKTVGVEGFEKIVAIKRILPSVAEDEEFIKMFVDEAKITSQLNHANLAQTFDLGKIDDTYYIAMEYVPGRDLRAVFERLKRRGERMPQGLAAFVMARVCEGLDYAHRKRDHSGRELNIVHRDVSPQNVIVSFEGEVKLIDFGIAKAANKITKTQAGILKGKFGYMSPEQVRGLSLDRRSDIFAAGVVLYELCTGERLFTGSSDFSVLEKVQAAKVTPPSQIEPSIPLKLERIILKALAREPEDRYQHAADLAGDLTRFLLDQMHAVTRDDAAAFMRTLFPEDAEGKNQPQRRPPPRVNDEASRKTAPRIEDLPSRLEEDGRVLGEDDPDRTELEQNPLPMIHKMPVAPPPKAPPAPPPKAPSAPPPALAADESEERTENTDGPTRPMSMVELAAAEREFIKRQEQARKLGAPEDTPTPPGPPAPLAELFARGDEPTSTPVQRPVRETPRPRRDPPLLPETLLQGVEPEERKPAPPPAPPQQQRASGPRPAPAAPAPAPEPPRAPPSPAANISPASDAPPPRRGSRGSPIARRPITMRPPSIEVPIEDQKTQVKRAPPAPPVLPHDGRMVLNKPTLVGEDPLPADESTNSTLTLRARWMRRIQVGIVLLALVIAAWALLSTPKGRKRGAPGEPVSAAAAGSLTVTLDPPDAQLLLDGALVKDTNDAQWSEPHLSAGAEHVLTARHNGFAEKVVQVTLQAGEQKTLTVGLDPVTADLVVLSSPPGAQVFLDGEKKGLTPTLLTGLDTARAHAVTVERKCYRAWQVAVPPRAGKRQLAATLEPAPGACPGRHLETSGMPTPQGLPDEAQQNATLGFLSLGSRPSANVLIDGVDIGQSTPLLAWPLTNGSHEVQLISQGRGKQLTVDIRVGETHSEIVDLSAPAAKKRGRR